MAVSGQIPGVLLQRCILGAVVFSGTIGCDVAGHKLDSGSGPTHRPIPAAVDIKPTPPNDVAGGAAGSAKQAAFEDAIYEQMQQRISWRLENEPLSELSDRVGKILKIPIIVDGEELYDLGIDKHKVSGTYEDAPLEIALDNALRELGLQWTIQNNSLLLTSPDKAQKY